MCDYSLQGIPNRLAIEGEELVTYRFQTGSIGLASPADIDAHSRPAPKSSQRGPWWSNLMGWLLPADASCQVPAICIAPGTRLLMSCIPVVLQRDLGLHPREEVTFTQTTAEAFHYRDAIRFSAGQLAMLQSLREGVRFDVLRSAPIEEENAPVTGRAAARVRLTPPFARLLPRSEH
jgi:hypothetical protein